jgi:hypothetical protein
MLKNMLALVTAGVIAGLFVGLVPPPAPASAKTAGIAVSEPAAGRSAIAVSAPTIRPGGCGQAWPFYEQACLRDSREPNSAARAARVVARNK